jgi:hypothetical protein
MKFKKLLGIFFVLTLITTTVFGFSAENSRQGFDRNSTDLHQGFTLSKAATTPGLAACFLDSSRQAFPLGQSGNGAKLSQNQIKHISKHIPSEFAKQTKYLSAEALENIAKNRTFFNPAWTKDQVVSAVEGALNEALKKGVTNGSYNYQTLGETIKIFLKNGQLDTAFGLHGL